MPIRDAIDVRLALQPRESVFQIAQFQLAEVLVNGPRRFRALAAGRAVVANPDDVALLRQHLVPHVGGAAPRIPHLRRVWASVGERHHRILLFGIEVRRLDHHRFHLKAIARLHLQQLSRAQFVLLERLDFVFIDDAHQFAVRIVEPRLRSAC